jgi:hypothetical protein
VEKHTARRLIGTAATVVLAASVMVTVAAPAHAATRGFDGSTITVAGMGIKGQLPSAEVGARARIKRFNDTNEIKGVKIQYAEMADDKQDSATALSEARRLVTQVGAFAIVGDISANNPGDYFAQQHVPFFGGAFDNTYCSVKPSTSVWGFGIYGCLGTDGSSFVGDAGKVPYQYVTAQLHKQHPSLVIFSDDNATGKRLASQAAVAYRGAGFDVVAVPPCRPRATTRRSSTACSPGTTATRRNRFCVRRRSTASVCGTCSKHAASMVCSSPVSTRHRW